VQYPRPISSDPAQAGVRTTPKSHQGTEESRKRFCAATALSTVRLAPPRRSAYGVNRLSIRCGEVASVSFNNGENGQRWAEELNKTPFCLALPEDKPKIFWKVRKPEEIKEVKFELFCRGHANAIATETWADGNGLKEKLEQGKEEAEKAGYTGSIEWDPTAFLKLDKALQIDGRTAFPDGVPTVERSPYQVRLTVTRLEVAEELEKDLEGYPTVAWTYFHVLVQSIALEWGDKALLPERQVRQKDDPPGKTLDLRKDRVTQAEKDLVDGLKRDHPTPSAGDIPLVLDVDAAEGNATDQDPIPPFAGTQGRFNGVADLWGEGPRVPLVAKLTVKKNDGSAASADTSKNAIGSAELVWDWEDPADPAESRAQRWLTGRGSPLSLTWLDARLRADQGPDHPLGSQNCPVARGGKRGAGATVFPDHGGADPFPFEVRAMAAPRPWAAVTRASTKDGDKKGLAATIFQPSRISGDRFRVNVYLAPHDDSGAIVLPPEDGYTLRGRVEQVPPAWQLPHASSGIFEIFHRTKVKLFVLPKSAFDAHVIEETKNYYRAAVGLILDFVDPLPAPFPNDFKTKDCFDKAIKDLNSQGKGGLLMDFVFPDQEYPPADESQLLQVRSWAEYKDEVKRKFQENQIFFLKTEYREVEADERLIPKDLMEGNYKSVGGFRVYFVDHLLLKSGEAEAYGLCRDRERRLTAFVLSKNGKEFAKGAKVDEDTIADSPTKASGWWSSLEFAFDETGRDESRVTVTIGNNSTELTFPKKGGLRKKVSQSLNGEARGALKQLLIDAVRARAPSNDALKVIIKGKRDTDRTITRFENVKSFVEELIESHVVVDKRRVFEQFTGQKRSGFDQNYYETTASSFVKYILLKFFGTYGAARKAQLDERGAHYFQFAPASKVTTIPTGGADKGSSRPSLGLGYINLPGNVQSGAKQAFLEKLPLVIHELGHTFYLKHAPHEIFDQNDPNSAEPPNHVQHDSCLMNYDTDGTGEFFCGKCLLHLRGWKYDDLSNATDRAAALNSLDEEYRVAARHKKPWLRLRKAYLLSLADEIVNAEAAIKARRTQRDKRIGERLGGPKAKAWQEELKAIDAVPEPDRSEEQKERKKTLERRLKDLESEAWREGDEGGGAPDDRDRNALQAAARAVLDEVHAATEEFAAARIPYDSKLGVTFLRNITMVEAKYGEASKALKLYEQLRQLTNHDQDLEVTGPKSLIATITQDYEYEVTLDVGDVNEIFGNYLGSNEGQMERLQVLGLFNHPLSYGGEPHPDAEECLRYSQRHAQSIDVGLTPGGSEIKKFLLGTEDGKLPARGRSSKLRLPGGWTVLNSQYYMSQKFPPDVDPDQDGKIPAALPYSSYMLDYGTLRYGVEQSFLRANPALGKIPLVAHVRRRRRADRNSAWEDAPYAYVYFQLLPPIRPNYKDRAPARTEVAGGFSFHDQVVAPPLRMDPGAPGDYLKNHLDGYEPSPDGDPQAGNAHHDVGGKRLMAALGDVSSSVEDPDWGVMQNVFCTPRSGGFMPLPSQPQGEKIPHAVCVAADAQGRAKVTFAPSTIGGDAYRLRAFVGPPTIGKEKLTEEDAAFETGTMIRWRTIRACRYLWTDNVAKKRDLPPEIVRQADKSGFGHAYINNPKPLKPIDLRKRFTQELARAYCELIIEPRALKPESLHTEEANIRREVSDLARSSWVNNRTASARSVKPFRTLMVGDGVDYRVQLGCNRIEPGTVSICPKNDNPQPGDEKKHALANDFGADRTTAGRANFLETKPPVLQGYIDYDQREVSISFGEIQEENGANRQFEVCYHPANYLDLENVLIFPERSPFLINVRTPESYNAAIAGRNFLRMDDIDDKGMPKQFGQFMKDGMGFGKGFLLAAFARGVGDRVGPMKAYYPGLVFLHAWKLDSVNGIYDAGQEGKGVGQAIFFTGEDVDLAVHEAGHGLYLMHAPTATGWEKVDHQHVQLKGDSTACVMSYEPNKVGDYCGKCVASLRGMYIGKLVEVVENNKKVMRVRAEPPFDS
jgi:hypothetical protein